MIKKLCGFLLYYTVFVIVWGAWVRISHSGDGCGKSWPLCEGALFPKTLESEVWIEYFHRLTSGLYGLFVLFILILVYRNFGKDSIVRRAALTTFVLMMIEAALGAALVLKGLVGSNATLYRLVVMTLHQINSLLLVGSTVVLYSLLKKSDNFSFKKLVSHRGLLLIFILIPATGAWAALSNTLFPSEGIVQGLMADFDLSSPWILKLRVVHPILATIFALYWSYYFYNLSIDSEDPNLKSSSRNLSIFLVVSFLFGGLTLLSLSPVWMKLVHLTLAQGLWIFMVHYVMTSLLSTKR
jgi:cytochrome c oxidase assembly protein subunit 15